MFFRRHKIHQLSFDEHISSLKALGFTTTPEPAGGIRVTRKGYAAVIEDLGGGTLKIGKAGVLLGNEISMLVSGGYQMFLRAPSGREMPALASHLTGLHDFEEDLREGLGLTSLYNVSLGTTSDEHLYDRVVDRDSAPHLRPWEKKPASA
jgi:hypothetical protein